MDPHLFRRQTGLVYWHKYMYVSFDLYELTTTTQVVMHETQDYNDVMTYSVEMMQRFLQHAICLLETFIYV